MKQAAQHRLACARPARVGFGREYERRASHVPDVELEHRTADVYFRRRASFRGVYARLVDSCLSRPGAYFRPCAYFRPGGQSRPGVEGVERQLGACDRELWHREHEPQL